MNTLGWVALAALVAVLILHYWLGLGAESLLWDTCLPEAPRPERPWPDFSRCWGRH